MKKIIETIYYWVNCKTHTLKILEKIKWKHIISMQELWLYIENASYDEYGNWIYNSKIFMTKSPSDFYIRIINKLVKMKIVKKRNGNRCEIIW